MVQAFAVMRGPVFLFMNSGKPRKGVFDAFLPLG